MNVTVEKAEELDLTHYAKEPRSTGGFKRGLIVVTVQNVCPKMIEHIVRPNPLIAYFQVSTWDTLTEKGVTYRPQTPSSIETCCVGQIVERRHLSKYRRHVFENRKQMFALIDALNHMGSEHAVLTRMQDFHPLSPKPDVHVIDPRTWLEIPYKAVAIKVGAVVAPAVHRPFTLIQGDLPDSPRVGG